MKSNIRQLVDYLFGRKDYQKFERKYKAEDVLNVATALIINNQMELLDSIVTHIFLKMKANQTYSENDWNLIVDILKISLDSKCLKSKLYELLVENIEDANSSPILTKLKSSLSSTQIGTLIGILRELETNTGAQKIQFIIRFLSQDSNSTLKNHIDDDDTLKPSPCTSSQRSVSMIFSNLNSDSTATATATATAATAATAASKLTSTPA